MKHKDYYEILGVDQGATAKDIQDAFHTLARAYHPDARPDDPQAEERFKEISAAYDVLSDPEERAEYDRRIGDTRHRPHRADGRPDAAAWERRASGWTGDPDWGNWISEQDERTLTDFVIRQLGRHAERDEIVTRLCGLGNMPWSPAEAFVYWVETNHRRAIAKRQSPLLLVVSVGTLIGGVVLTIFYGYAIVLWFEGVPAPLVATICLTQATSVFGPFLIGLGMIAGGAIGTWRVVRVLRGA